MDEGIIPILRNNFTFERLKAADKCEVICQGDIIENLGIFYEGMKAC